mgnify:CR=1 FL=1
MLKKSPRIIRQTTSDGFVVFTIRASKGEADALERILEGAGMLLDFAARDAVERASLEERPGAALRRLRTRLKLTQREVALIAGTTQARISDWESGLREIPPEAALALAAYFNVAASIFRPA